jgi:quercetin dioxygenase-like cupin family protein
MTCALGASAAWAQTAPTAQARDLMTQALGGSGGIAGKEAAMLTVEYAPGASSPRHRHNSHTFVYVLEGAVEMQVDGGPLVKLAAGETFYENPGDIHAVSRNASSTQPAKILVFMVKDIGRPRTEPVR